MRYAMIVSPLRRLLRRCRITMPRAADTLPSRHDARYCRRRRRCRYATPLRCHYAARHYRHCRHLIRLRRFADYHATIDCRLFLTLLAAFFLCHAA